jgi:hypothetical protein
MKFIDFITTYADREWWKPRLILVAIYIFVCFLSVESAECVSECGSYNESYENLSEGYRLFTWLNAHITEGWVTAVATVFIGWFTLTLRRSTDKLWDAGERQLVHLRETTKRQLRAYVMAEVGGGAFQDATHHFQATPKIVNTGETPAHSIFWIVHSAIFPVPLPDNFVFPDLPKPNNGGMSLGKGQEMQISGTIADLVEPGQVSLIKTGDAGALYAWGVVTYDDVFGDPHTLKFAQVITWSIDGSQVRATYTHQHNYSD